MCFQSPRPSLTVGQPFLRERRREASQPAVIDGLVAATALEHDLIVATRNVKDFAGLGVEIFNPWVTT